jgi:hypothetical protein
MFIGNAEGLIYYYRNDGSTTVPNFTLISTNYNGIDVGDRSAPTFVDIDDDNDYDLFIGDLIGTIWHYRNDGTTATPSWTYVTDNYSSIDVGDQSIPVFEDIDNDGDPDLFIGEAMGYIHYYQNNGTPSSPSFTLVSGQYGDIYVEENTSPCFGDIDNDGDGDLFIGERWGGLNHWEQDVPDVIPPNAPYLYAEKSAFGNNVVLTWNMITTDTLGNPESMDHYVVYRSTDPAFIPINSDSIGIAVHPDTTYTDMGVLPAASSYYYLVKAVDDSDNKSVKSNMGYKFNKFLNENTGSTGDRNWCSIPWHSEYSSVSNLTTDLSPGGEAILKITNLKGDQTFESWIYHTVVGWYGADFSISSGRGYEMIGAVDTTLVLVGSNNPQGNVILNENSGAVGDRNWIAIPYNAVYDSIRDITDEYSTAGQAIVKCTNLKDDQTFESWIYHPVIGWYGSNYSINRGRAYEFIAALDTTWDPTEYSNRMGDIQRKVTVGQRVYGYLGINTEPDRSPAWVCSPDQDIMDPSHYHLSRDNSISDMAPRNAGISHIIRTEMEIDPNDQISFTAYRLDEPSDAVTENTVGSCIVHYNNLGVIWLDVGNFLQPWRDGEQIVLLICISNPFTGLRFAASKIALRQGYDIQDITMPVFIPVTCTNQHSGDPVSTANPLVIGYSLIENGQRLSTSIIPALKQLVSTTGMEIRPVLIGGYEVTIDKFQEDTPPPFELPHSFGLEISPNPCRVHTIFEFSIPHPCHVSINVYDITGRVVTTLTSGMKEPGWYSIRWDGKDNQGDQVANGVYFVHMQGGTYHSRQKVILMK